MRGPGLGRWRCTPVVLVAGLWLLGAAPAAADPGDTLDALRDYCLGPALYLVAACGALFALWQWARGRKEAVLYALGGLIFLAFVRQAVVQWLAPGVVGGAHPAGLYLGEFPVYGQTPSVQVPGEVNTYQDIRAWGYLGLVYCNLITTFCFQHGVPVLIATVGALVTYWRVAIQHQAGSMVSYLVTVILVATFAVVPWVYFAPRDTASVLDNDAVRAINTFNAQTLGGSLTTSSSLMVPLLPGLILLGGVDLSEGVGSLLNAHPVQGYAAQLLRAARASQLPEDWLPRYQEFAVQCAAAQKGFVLSENNPRAYNPTVDFSRAMFSAMQSHQVSGASANALSSWGDNLFAWIPLHGYVFNDAEDWEVFHQARTLSARDREAITATTSHMTSVPSTLTGDEKSASLADWSRIAVGDPGSHQYATVSAISDAEDGDYVWTLPFNAMLATGGVHPWDDASFSPDANAIAIPYRSLPLDASGGALGNLTLTVDTQDDQVGTSVSGFDTLQPADASGGGTFTLTDDSQYLRDLATASVSNTAGGSVTIHPLDWGDQLRAALVHTYRAELCLNACGSFEHKNFWGCLVSGQFISLAASHPQCQSGADLTQVFYGAALAGASYQPGGSPSYASLIEGSLYHRYPAKPRSDADLAALGEDVLSGATAQSGAQDADGQLAQSAGEMRILADLIMSAPGNYSQNPLAIDPYNLPKETSAGTPSFWHLLEDLPKAALWLLQTFVALAEAIISWMWPPFMGVVIVMFLLLYPLFAMLALWPGRWQVLTDWCRGMCWVLLWAPLVSLGYSFKNAGALLTQDSGFGSQLPLPGHTVLAVIGCCIIVMAPPIANAILSPSYASLARMGASIYGTGFKVLAMSTQMAVAMASIGAATAGAAAGGALGAAGAAGGGTAGVAGSRGVATAAAGAAGDGGGGAGGGGGGVRSAAAGSPASSGGSGGGRLASALARARRFAAQGAHLAQPLWSGASQSLNAGMDLIDRAGLQEGVHGAGGGFGGAGRSVTEPVERAWGASIARQRAGQAAAAVAAAGPGRGGATLAPEASGGPGSALPPPRPGAGSSPDPRGYVQATQASAAGALPGQLPAATARAQAWSRLAGARARHDPATVRQAAWELSRDALLDGEQARSRGDLPAQLEALHQQALAEAVLEGMGALDGARAARCRNEALAVAQTLERQGAARRAAPQDALARTQASLWALQAEAGVREQDTSQDRALPPQAQSAGERALRGYAGASQELAEALQLAAGASEGDDPRALRSLVGCAAGLTLLSAQATRLGEAARGQLTMPDELSQGALRRDLAIAAGASGQVGGSLVRAITASAAGDDAGCRGWLARAGAQARTRLESGTLAPAQQRELASYAEVLDRSAEAVGSRDEADPVARQQAFLQGLAGAPPLGAPLDGFRFA